MRKISIAMFAVVALAVALSAAPNALAQGAAAPAKQVTKVGYLSCHVASGWGIIFGSSRKLDCVYTPAETGKKIENYSGSITKFGGHRLPAVRRNSLDRARAGNEDYGKSRAAFRALWRSYRERDRGSRRRRQRAGRRDGWVDLAPTAQHRGQYRSQCCRWGGNDGAEVRLRSGHPSLGLCGGTGKRAGRKMPRPFFIMSKEVWDKRRPCWRAAGDSISFGAESQVVPVLQEMLAE